MNVYRPFWKNFQNTPILSLKNGGSSGIGNARLRPDSPLFRGNRSFFRGLPELQKRYSKNPFREHAYFFLYIERQLLYN